MTPLYDMLVGESLRTVSLGESVSVGRDWLPLLLAGIAAAASVGAAVLYGVFSHRLVRIQKSFNTWTESLRDPSPKLIRGRVTLWPPMHGRPLELKRDDAKYEYNYHEVCPDTDTLDNALAGVLTLKLEECRDAEEPSPGRLYVDLSLSNPGDTPIYGSGNVEIHDRETGTSITGRHSGASKEPFVIPPRDKNDVKMAIILSPKSSRTFSSLLKKGVDVTLGYITGSGKKKITFEAVSSFKFDWTPASHKDSASS